MRQAPGRGPYSHAMQKHKPGCPAAVAIAAARLCAALSPAEIKFEVEAPGQIVREVLITPPISLTDRSNIRELVGLIHGEASVSAFASSSALSSAAIFLSR